MATADELRQDAQWLRDRADEYDRRGDARWAEKLRGCADVGDDWAREKNGR